MAGSLVLNIFCMSRGVQVKEISTIESLSYLFVPCLAFVLFKENITWRKVGAIVVIIIGIIIIRIAGTDTELSVEKTKHPVRVHHFLTKALLIAEICGH